MKVLFSTVLEHHNSFNNNSYCFVMDKKEITNSRMMFTQSEITNRLNLFHRQKVTWKKIFAKTVLYYCY